MCDSASIQLHLWNPLFIVPPSDLLHGTTYKLTWDNMELLCALLSLHIHKKKNNTYPGRLNQFIFQENIYSRLNDQNANKMKNIGKRSKDAD